MHSKHTHTPTVSPESGFQAGNQSAAKRGSNLKTRRLSKPDVDCEYSMRRNMGRNVGQEVCGRLWRSSSNAVGGGGGGGVRRKQELQN